jgi:hypothetical protein
LTIANTQATIFLGVMMPGAKTYTFTLLIDGPDLQEDGRIDALFEAGCGDATFGRRDSVQFADFDRDAPSLAAAIHSAIRDIRSAVPEAEIVRVEPEEFVSAQVIADRLGISKEYVRLLADGSRGPGGFPSVVRWIDTKTRVWSWNDVAEWFDTRLGRSVAAAGDAHTVAAFNGILEFRRHAARVPKADERDEVMEFLREDDELRLMLDA